MPHPSTDPKIFGLVQIFCARPKIDFTFCARPKVDFHNSKIIFWSGTKILGPSKCVIQYLFGQAQIILGPVEGRVTKGQLISKHFFEAIVFPKKR